MSEQNNCLLAIAAIATICLAAISRQLNGQVIALCVVAIAGLGGFEVYKRAKMAVSEG